MEPDFRLREAFRAALGGADIGLARAVIAGAIDEGASPGRVYVDIVRPVLADLPAHDGELSPARVARIGEVLSSDLVAQLPELTQTGAGRAAVLSSRGDGVEAVDGRIAVEFLRTYGWTIQQLTSDEPGISAEGAPEGFELAAAVISGLEDARRLAPLCTELRRRSDPPLAILCDFSGKGRPGAAIETLGADAVVTDPDNLLDEVRERLPAPGIRRWGIQLKRTGTELTLTPTGALNRTNAARLAEIVSTRVGTFTRLVLDLRQLAEIEPAGMTELSGWSEDGPLSGIDVVVALDPASQARLDATGIELIFPVVATAPA